MQSEGLIFFSSNSLRQRHPRPSSFSSRPINKSSGLQGNPVVLLLYRKPQKSEIFGAASQDGALPLSPFSSAPQEGGTALIFALKNS